MQRLALLLHKASHGFVLAIGGAVDFESFIVLQAPRDS
jgi:hypothetical protein